MKTVIIIADSQPALKGAAHSQADVAGYMYDIRGEKDYKEHRLPPLPREIKSYSDRTPGVDFNDSRLLLRRGYGWASYQATPPPSAPAPAPAV